jgi:putative transposase
LVRRKGTKMKAKRFTEEQIISILQQAEAGVKAADLCRQYGRGEATVYKWKAKYGGLQVSDAQKLKRLEEENAQRKRVVADLTLDNVALKDLLTKNGRACGPESGGCSLDDRASDE